MELYIRSQDRKVLKEQKFLKIEEVENRTYKYGDIGKSNEYAIKDDNVLLGIYATEKRALEVLDEIQKILMPPMLINNSEGFITGKDDSIHIINPSYNKIEQPSTCVYEMPKE